MEKREPMVGASTRSAIILVLAVLCWLPCRQVEALHLLELYIEGAAYNQELENWVVAPPRFPWDKPFRVWAVGAERPGGSTIPDSRAPFPHAASGPFHGERAIAESHSQAGGPGPGSPFGHRGSAALSANDRSGWNPPSRGASGGASGSGARGNSEPHALNTSTRAVGKGDPLPSGAGPFSPPGDLAIGGPLPKEIPPTDFPPTHPLSGALDGLIAEGEFDNPGFPPKGANDPSLAKGGGPMLDGALENEGDISPSKTELPPQPSLAAGSSDASAHLANLPEPASLVLWALLSLPALTRVRRRK